MTKKNVLQQISYIGRAGGDGAVGTVCDAKDAARAPDDGAVRDGPVCLLLDGAVCMCVKVCSRTKSHRNDRML